MHRLFLDGNLEKVFSHQFLGGSAPHCIIGSGSVFVYMFPTVYKVVDGRGKGDSLWSHLYDPGLIMPGLIMYWRSGIATSSTLVDPHKVGGSVCSCFILFIEAISPMKSRWSKYMVVATV